MALIPQNDLQADVFRQYINYFLEKDRVRNTYAFLLTFTDRHGLFEKWFDVPGPTE